MNKQTFLITLSILITPLLHTAEHSKRHFSLPHQDRSPSVPLDNKDHPDKCDDWLEKKIDTLVAGFFERDRQPPEHRISTSETSIDTTSPPRAPQASTLEHRDRTTLAPRQKDSWPKAQKKPRKKNQFYCNDIRCTKKKHDWKTLYKLKRHALTHTGEKPFECIICSECFNQESTTITHMRARIHIESTKETLRETYGLADNEDVPKHLLSNASLSQFIKDTRK